MVGFHYSTYSMEPKKCKQLIAFISQRSRGKEGRNQLNADFRILDKV